jgi:hypothetical protein
MADGSADIDIHINWPLPLALGFNLPFFWLLAYTHPHLGSTAVQSTRAAPVSDFFWASAQSNKKQGNYR